MGASWRPILFLVVVVVVVVVILRHDAPFNLCVSIRSSGVFLYGTHAVITVAVVMS